MEKPQQKAPTKIEEPQQPEKHPLNPAIFEFAKRAQEEFEARKNRGGRETLIVYGQEIPPWYFNQMKEYTLNILKLSSNNSFNKLNEITAFYLHLKNKGIIELLDKAVAQMNIAL